LIKHITGICDKGKYLKHENPVYYKKNVLYAKPKQSTGCQAASPVYSYRNKNDKIESLSSLSITININNTIN